jgi:hypothetical protein
MGFYIGLLLKKLESQGMKEKKRLVWVWVPGDEEETSVRGLRE